MGPLFRVLLAILVIVRAVGALFARIGQPPVIGEMIAGLLLGPPTLFAMMILMAVTTTFATPPILKLVRRDLSAG